MSRYTHPYESATTERLLETSCMAEPDNAAKLAPGPIAVRLRLCSAYASKGFRTDYTPIPTRWLELVFTDSTGRRWRQCWTYSGRRYARAETDYDRLAADFAAHPAPA